MSGSSDYALHLGAGIYLVNLGVGLAAQLLHAKFGVFHHVLYAIVLGAAGLATALAFHPALILVLLALAALPLTKPGKAAHPILAIVGALGYVGAYLL